MNTGQVSEGQAGQSGHAGWSEWVWGREGPPESCCSDGGARVTVLITSLLCLIFFIVGSLMAFLGISNDPVFITGIVFVSLGVVCAFISATLRRLIWNNSVMRTGGQGGGIENATMTVTNVTGGSSDASQSPEDVTSSYRVYRYGMQSGMAAMGTEVPTQQHGYSGGAETHPYPQAILNYTEAPHLTPNATYPTSPISPGASVPHISAPSAPPIGNTAIYNPSAAGNQVGVVESASVKGDIPPPPSYDDVISDNEKCEK